MTKITENDMLDMAQSNFPEWYVEVETYDSGHMVITQWPESISGTLPARRIVLSPRQAMNVSNVVRRDIRLRKEKEGGE